MRKIFILIPVLLFAANVYGQNKRLNIDEVEISLSYRTTLRPAPIIGTVVSEHLETIAFSPAHRSSQIETPSNALHFDLNLFKLQKSSANFQTEQKVYGGVALHLEQRLVQYAFNEEVVSERDLNPPLGGLERTYERTHIRYFNQLNRFELKGGYQVLQHLNRTWNVHLSSELGFGIPFQNQIIVSTETASDIEIQYEDQSKTTSSSSNYRIERLSKEKNWLLSPSLKAGFDYKLFERRRLFASANFQAGYLMYFEDSKASTEFWNGLSLGIKSTL